MAKNKSKESVKDNMLINRIKNLKVVGDSVTVIGKKDSIRVTMSHAKADMDCNLSMTIISESDVTAVIKRES